MLEWLILILVSVLVIWLHNRVLIGISRKQHPIRMIWIMILLSLSHFLHVTLFAVALYASVHWLELGTIINCPCDRFYDFLYFSASNYTSLGYGEYAAAGGIRMLASLEG